MSVLVTMTSGAYGCTTPVEIRKAADNSLVGSVSMCSSAAFLEPATLPATDSYVVVVNPTGATTGTATVALYDVTDVTTSIAINGSTVSVALTTPGQNARLPFTGTAGQQVSSAVTMTSGNFGCIWLLQIRKTSDNSLVGSASSCGSSVALGPLTLPSSTSYTLVIDAGGSSTGTANVTLTAP